MPRWWFEQIGFWGAPGTPPPDDPHPRPILPINVPSEDTSEMYKKKYPMGLAAAYPSSPLAAKQLKETPLAGFSAQVVAMIGLACALVGVGAGVGLSTYLGAKKGYQPLN